MLAYKGHLVSGCEIQAEGISGLTCATVYLVGFVLDDSCSFGCWLRDFQPQHSKNNFPDMPLYNRHHPDDGIGLSKDHDSPQTQR